jgi:hypothetical protein
MKRSTLSGHVSSLVLLVGLSASATLGLTGDVYSAGHVTTSAQTRTWAVTGSGEGAETLPVVTTGFRISGKVPGMLVPGRVVPMNLRLTNTMYVDLRVRRLAVTVTEVHKDGLPSTCRPADFSTRPAQLDRALPLHADTAGTLKALGLPRWRWPRIGMLNLPVNQDDCKNVTLALTFQGAARPVPR